MEAVLFVYFASLVNGLIHALNSFFIGFLITGIMLVTGGFIWVASTGSWEKYYGKDGELITEKQESSNRFALLKPYVVKVFVATIICKLLAVSIPEEKTVWYMAGAYVGQQALQSEIASDVYEIIKRKVKEQKELILEETIK